MKRTYIAALLIGVLAAGTALAQSTMLQANSWTVGHVPKYASQTYGGQPVLIDSGLPPGSPNVTIVASLPSCSSGTKGLLYVVTDALSPTWNATLVGGSTTTVLALCNGSNWVAG